MDVSDERDAGTNQHDKRTRSNPQHDNAGHHPSHHPDPARYVANPLSNLSPPLVPNSWPNRALRAPRPVQNREPHRIQMRTLPSQIVSWLLPDVRSRKRHRANPSRGPARSGDGRTFAVVMGKAAAWKLAESGAPTAPGLQEWPCGTHRRATLMRGVMRGQMSTDPTDRRIGAARSRAGSGSAGSALRPSPCVLRIRGAKRGSGQRPSPVSSRRWIEFLGRSASAWKPMHRLVGSRHQR
jgi:hypothetical protein